VLTNFREQNVFQIKETFDGIIETFQNEPTIARTAASLIMHQKRHGSGVEALQAYTKAKRECLELFGAEKLTKDIAITAAGLVFEGKYQDATSAHARYREILLETLPLFGANT
jgi:hypothetical protein